MSQKVPNKKIARIQSEIDRKGSTPVKMPGTISMEEVSATILRLVQKNEELELQVQKLRTQGLIKDDLLDTFLKPTWREGKLELRDEIFESSDEEETAQPTDAESAERE